MERKNNNPYSNVHHLPLPDTEPSRSERLFELAMRPVTLTVDILTASRAMVDAAIQKLDEGSDPLEQPNSAKTNPAEFVGWSNQTQQELSDLGFNQDEIVRHRPGRITGHKKLLERLVTATHD